MLVFSTRELWLQAALLPLLQVSAKKRFSLLALEKDLVMWPLGRAANESNAETPGRSTPPVLTPRFVKP